MTSVFASGSKASLLFLPSNSLFIFRTKNVIFGLRPKCGYSQKSCKYSYELNCECKWQFDLKNPVKCDVSKWESSCHQTSTAATCCCNSGKLVYIFLHILHLEFNYQLDYFGNLQNVENKAKWSRESLFILSSQIQKITFWSMFKTQKQRFDCVCDL